ncbi:hypothetical protein [Risungbinella massiliensis]|uniref:hypothetical protein n=1 Tax=Risungbinella massiliensis TaxID=1329796 RepID=UPI0005CBAA62|nr:hypothetical protein [Risungbinella massiliensis]
MEGKQKHQGNWKRFIIFTFIIGLVVGFFSVRSDNLPYFGKGMTVSVFEIVLSYLAVMINSLPIWFIVAMIVGYLFGRNIKEGILLGAIYTVIAITLYFVIGNFYEDTQIPLSFKEQIETLAIWYGASIVGGGIGGGVGFLYKKTPYVLLILLLGLILQLFVNGAGSWSDIVRVAQNVTFCLMIVGIICLLMIVKRTTRETDEFSRSL